ncbi:MAG: hypothetical protein QOG75_7052 [Mycobacterium sp.]|jgi:hypothetical protein|nr:hypothetical protein [Mycobacterium sp.]
MRRFGVREMFMVCTFVRCVTSVGWQSMSMLTNDMKLGSDAERILNEEPGLFVG